MRGTALKQGSRRQLQGNNSGRVCVLEFSSKTDLKPICSTSATGSWLIVGDTRQVLGRLPSNSIQTCITSPPYWSLRNYGIDGQIGLELAFKDYLKDLVSVFNE